MLSGPGTVAFAHASAAVTTAKFSAPGSYTLALSAHDTELTTSDEVVVTVQPENQPPTANAGPDQTIRLPNGANLNGLVSDDGYPLGSALSSTWSQVSGPGAVVFSHPGQARTTASCDAPGAYVLRLTASDSQFTISDDVVVTIGSVNQPPTVNAGVDQAVTLANRTATLAGIVSDDGLPNGGALSATWEIVSGPGAVSFSQSNQLNTTITVCDPGAYVLRLTVSDSESIGTDEVTVTVKTIHNITLRSGNGNVGMLDPLNQFSTDGGATYQDAYIIAPYPVWSVIAGTQYLNKNPDYWMAGAYNWYAPNSVTKYRSSFTLPADFSAPALNGLTQVDNYVDVYLNGMFVGRTGGFNGPPKPFTTSNPSFFRAGTNVVEFDVEDVGGGVGGFDYKAEISYLSTNVRPNAPPQVSAGADETITLPQTALLIGTATDDDLPCDKNLTASWTQVSGPGGVAFSAPDALTTSAAFSAPGVYILRLTVSDSQLIATGEVRLSVNPVAPTNQLIDDGSIAESGR